MFSCVFAPLLCLRLTRLDVSKVFFIILIVIIIIIRELQILRRVRLREYDIIFLSTK